MVDEDKHIFAPVSIEDVASVLGEESLDVSTLCMSKNINPYSLIRPIKTDFPYTEVSSMKTLLHLGDLKNPTDDYKWEEKQWGYQVPYVGHPGEIEKIMDVPWYRPVPTDNTYKSLNHFDGYQHNASPFFYWFTDAHAGQEMKVNILPGAKQTNIISSNGKGNKGGVISIPEVFGDKEFWCGCSIRMPSGGGWSNHIHHTPINPNDTSYPIITIDTGIYPAANQTFMIIPWISNMDAPTYGSNISFVPKDFKCYGLKFADLEDFKAFEAISIPDYTVSLGVSYLDIIVNENKTLITGLKITAFNSYPDTAFKITNMYMNVKVIHYGTMPTEEFTRTCNWGNGEWIVEKSSHSTYLWDDYLNIPINANNVKEVRMQIFATAVQYPATPNGIHVYCESPEIRYIPTF